MFKDILSSVKNTRTSKAAVATIVIALVAAGLRAFDVISDAQIETFFDAATKIGLALTLLFSRMALGEARAENRKLTEEVKEEVSK